VQLLYALLPLLPLFSHRSALTQSINASRVQRRASPTQESNATETVGTQIRSPETGDWTPSSSICFVVLRLVTRTPANAKQRCSTLSLRSRRVGHMTMTKPTLRWSPFGCRSRARVLNTPATCIILRQMLKTFSISNNFCMHSNINTAVPKPLVKGFKRILKNTNSIW